MSAARQSKWFFRGREARGRGRERAVPDGRVSLDSRRQFYAGWDEEDRLQRPPVTDAQAVEAADVLARLKEAVRKL